MTVIPFPTPGAPGGVCNVCKRETGNLPRHRPACARLHGRPALGINLTPEDEALIRRAGTHAAHEHTLPAAQRWHGGVNDLDVARLVFQLERGLMIVPSHGGRTWVPLEPMPAMRMSLTGIVNEALRLQVVRHGTERTGASAYRTFLTPAVTHARSAAAPGRPACGLHRMGPVRWRLLDSDDLMYVDCQGCMDQVSSRIVQI
jgi:hypothetical protein